MYSRNRHDELRYAPLFSVRSNFCSWLHAHIFHFTRHEATRPALSSAGRRAPAHGVRTQHGHRAHGHPTQPFTSPIALQPNTCAQPARSRFPSTPGGTRQVRPLPGNRAATELCTHVCMLSSPRCRHNTPLAQLPAGRSRACGVARPPLFGAHRCAHSGAGGSRAALARHGESAPQSSRSTYTSRSVRS